MDMYLTRKMHDKKLPVRKYLEMLKVPLTFILLAVKG